MVSVPIRGHPRVMLRKVFPMFHSKMADQVALEEEMRDVTRARYFRLHANAEDRSEMAETHAGRNVFDFVYEPFLHRLNEWVEEKKQGKAGRRPRAVKMIDDFGDNQTLAFIFVKHLINTTLTVQTRGKIKAARLTRVALVCSQAIHDELRMRYFEDNRRSLLRKIVKDFDKRDLPRRRRRDLMIKQFHTQQLEWQAPGWGYAERMNLGVVLIDIFEQATGSVEKFTHCDGPKTTTCLTFTDALEASLSERMDSAANLFTVYFPTLVPPRPWSNDSLVGGGYYTSNVQPYRFVKSAKMNYLREMENRDLSKILEPLNALQETAWRVNPVMVQVLTEIYHKDVEVKGLPPAEPVLPPPPPPGVDDDEEISQAYRKECYLVHDQNRRSISKRISVLNTISLARRFSLHEEIYFPYDVDSRGRAYPKVAFLNPQGPDYVKSLLEFAQGKPIETEEHAAFLAIAIANAWGQDKLPLQQRVDWVEDNEQMLCEIAQDPLGDLRWLKADEPFMALRGALEWLGFCEQGWGYNSHMPVHFDATCSGLQHFSALLLDEEGGFHVNLTGHEERQDIYQAVANKAEESIRREANTCDIASLALSLGISRGLCKRPVMIVPYAGTFSACMEYVYDHYRERAEDGEQFPVSLDVIRSKVSPLVAKHVWDAIASTVIAAREAMDWITHTARLAAKGQNVPIQWTTPDGFVVQQARFEEKQCRVKTFLDGGKILKLSYVKDTDQLDSRKMAQSLSPNYIHSLDAAHMRGSIRKAMEIGGMSFAMIHDSFGVHASDMPVFVEQCIKPAFVEMYAETNNLEKFRDELMMNVSDERKQDVRKLPVPGSLDIYEVLDSQFFFS